MHIFACILFCMFHSNVFYVHAACHAKKLRGSLARLDLRVGTIVALGQHLTLLDGLETSVRLAL